MSTATATAQATLQEFTNADFIQHKIESLENPHRDAQVLQYLYWDAAMSTYEIADKLGVGEPTIYNWMRNHDIERRDKIEGIKLRAIRDGSEESDSSGKSRWSFQD